MPFFVKKKKKKEKEKYECMDYRETMGNTSESPRMEHFTGQKKSSVGYSLQNHRWTQITPHLTLNQMVT
jgi:hypothetical protein